MRDCPWERGQTMVCCFGARRSRHRSGGGLAHWAWCWVAGRPLVAVEGCRARRAFPPLLLPGLHLQATQMAESELACKTCSNSRNSR